METVYHWEAFFVQSPYKMRLTSSFSWPLLMYSV